MQPNVYELIFASFVKYSDNICICLPNQEYTYSNLFTLSGKSVNIIRESSSKYVGVLAHRSLTAYLGVLSVLQAGKIYVPLNPKLPRHKLERIILTTNMTTIMVDNDSLDSFRDFMPEKQLLVIAPELSSKSLNRYPDHINILSQPEIDQLHICSEAVQPGHASAYLLFTSGSTGEPKGIEVSHKSVCDYLNCTQVRLNINSQDKCSQVFDLSFDLSLHDIFLTWMNGAALCVPDKNVLNPIRYIKDNNITVWFSVPSLANSLLKYNFLKPNIFPGLRISLFCGESFSAKLAEKWQEAAPNSVIENIYGPTEATIGISNYQWKTKGKNKVRNGIVSIGKIFPNQKYLIIDENDQPLPPNSIGELLLSGSQVILRYLTEEYNSSAKFKAIGDDRSIYYRTGDIVLEDSDGDLFFLQRKDHEFKIRGYRIEEEEINDAIRKISGIYDVITLPNNSQLGVMQEIISFVECNYSFSECEILKGVRKLLPAYMMPNRIYPVSKFPRNVNGKVDRSYFVRLLMEYNSK